jgi:hypothetical protein
MAKSNERKSKSPVMFDKAKFLLPKMEFFELDSATGEGFYLSELGGKDLLEYNELIRKLQAESGDRLTDAQGMELMIHLVLATACDAKGQPIFSQEDVALLSRKSPALLMDIANKAMEISGIKPDKEAKEAMDNLKKATSSSTAD